MSIKIFFVDLLNLTFVVALAGPAFASTFVGNGGGRGEVEREVTIRQLQDTHHLMSENQTGELCRCSDAFENHAMCAPLKSLNESQVHFCSQTLSAHLKEFERLLHDRAIHWAWADSDMSVIENGHARAAEAVANFGERSITIDQRRFIEMSSFDRMFLIQHELGHFIEIDGKRLTDEGAVGPFTESTGSRQLVDAMAAATVMRGVETHIDAHYRKQLGRSQGWKKNWLSLREGLVQTAPANGGYSPNSLNQTTLDYKHYFTSWGVVMGVRKASGDRTVLGSATAEEDRTAFLVGASYRYFPSQNPLSYWGQTHFVFNSLIESVSTRYHLFDEFVGQVQTTHTIGGLLEAQFTIPLFWGIWGMLGLGLEYAPNHFHLESSGNVSTDLQNNGIQTSTWLGVSYAF